MSAESDALHAVIEGDPAGAQRVLETFYPGELRELINALEMLDSLARDVLETKK